MVGQGKQTRSVAGYNRTEQTSCNQMGGMSMMALYRLSSYVLDAGVDYTGLE